VSGGFRGIRRAGRRPENLSQYIMTNASNPVEVNVPITGVKRLALLVEDAGDDISATTGIGPMQGRSSSAAEVRNFRQSQLRVRA